MSQSKTLYRGTFNWHGEIHHIYRHAFNTRQVFRLMLRALSSKLHRSHGDLALYFWNTDRYRIIVENKEGIKNEPT
jgi:hypothetical protein